MVEKVKLFGAIALGLLVLILMVQNRESMDTKVLWVTITMPRALLLLVTFVLGMGSGLLLAWWRSHHTSR